MGSNCGTHQNTKTKEGIDMKKAKIFIYLCLISLFFLASFSCIFISKKVYRFDKTGERAKITSPTKVHLYDGSMIVFANGFEMTGDYVKGKGILYDLTREHSKPVETISRDSVAFLEYYKKELQTGPFWGSLGAPLLFVAAIQNEDIHKAFFGSCPTVYSFDGEKYSLEAECFSYSISPTIETYDLDRIDHGKTFNGKFILNVRNEALETHYINQMKLVIVDHPEKYEPFPVNKPFLERKDQIILFGRESSILKAISKSGRDVKTLLTERDEQWYQSDSSVIQEISEKVEKDWIEIFTTVPEGANNMVVALRFRNTLFHTVEFYDLLLNGYGAQAIDWIGVKMADPIYLTQLYKWYQRYFGIYVELWNGDKIEKKVFIDDTGPIAWRQIAFELPVPKNRIAKLRFNFLPDNVMLDWIGISFDSSPEFTIHEAECSKIVDIRGRQKNILPTFLKQNDDQYFITYPAESYHLIFNVGDEPKGMNRTFFLNSRGFYIEWIRHNWLEFAESNEEKLTFQLNEASIIHAAKHWIAKKAEFEKQFFNSKIQLKGGKAQ